MLTRLEVRNFKRFDEVAIDLGHVVVFVGPNNTGKTTALQALTLWDAGLRAWVSEHGTEHRPNKKRPGISMNRKDLMALPIPSALYLWRDKHVRSSTRGKDKRRTENVRIDITVKGITAGREWVCGLEFDYANDESFYCRPLRTEVEGELEAMPIPPEALAHRIAYLPPMSGLADREFVKQAGEVGFLIGQGQTAQVLRNLCQAVYLENGDLWRRIVVHIEQLFGVKLQPPQLNATRAEITMSYLDESQNELDLSCAGRGLQQTLLLLTYLYANPRSALLLDEPDAHLEILRQRQIFNLLVEVAETQNSQIIAASHSEVVLNEAANRGKVVAFIGQPHTINDRVSQVQKALRELGFEQYYQAEQKGWVLYLENTTDLDILRVFATKLSHPVAAHLDRPFLHPVTTNLPQRARDHFFGLREAKSDLVGVALFDRLDREPNENAPLMEMMWKRREIENYFCTREVLLAYAQKDLGDDLFSHEERQRRVQIMEDAIESIAGSLSNLGRPSPWSVDIKVTDDCLDPLFKKYSEKLGLTLVLRKNEYYKLASLVDAESIDTEVREKLDAILAVAEKARIREST